MKKYYAFIGALAAVGFGFSTFAENIGNAADFVSMLTADPTGDYTLTDDIDLSGADYTTIAEFSGTLDGVGHTLTGLGAQSLCITNSGSIVGLTIDGAGTVRTASNVGQFCNVSKGGKFIDCTIKGYTLKHQSAGGGMQNGLFVAKAYEGTKFVRCVADANCMMDQDGKANELQGSLVGLLTVVNKSGIIASFVDCTNNAMIKATGDYNSNWGAGGLVGMVTSASAASIPEIDFIRCVNNGAVSSTGGSSNVGGILGQVMAAQDKGSTFRVRFVQCVNTGTVSCSSTANSAGGILGYANAAPVVTMSGCVNRGQVDAATAKSGGGLLGYWYPYSSDKGDGLQIVNCANYAAVTAKSAGGLAGEISTNAGWNNGTFSFRNSANYGTIGGSVVHAGIVPKISSGTGVNVTVEIKNCWTDATLYDSSSKSPTLEGNFCALDEGYDDAVALAGLNEAEDPLYFPWILGASGHPELCLFSAVAQGAYWVLFVDWNGALLKKELVADGGAATAPADPTRTSFEFVRWSPAYDSISACISVFAEYDPLSFTFAFDSAGGSVCASITRAYGDSVVMPRPVRDGYEFIGWSENLEFKNFSVCPDYDASLTALWKAEKELPARKLKVLYWQMKASNNSTRAQCVSDLKAVLEELSPDVIISCGNENTDALRTALSSGIPDYEFTVNGSNGSADGNGRLIGWKAGVYEAGAYFSTMPVSNSTIGYIPIHAVGSDYYFLLASTFYGTTKSVTDYLNGIGGTYTTARSKYPTATFLVAGFFDQFSKSSVWSTTYEGDYLQVLAAYKEKTGLIELNAGEDLQWLTYSSAYDPHTLADLQVSPVENASLANFTGYLTSFTLGKRSGLMLILR